MRVQMRFFANFREAVGTKTIERDYEVTTVGDALRELEAEYSGLAGELLEDGHVRPQVNVLLNGRDVQHEQGIETELGDEDTLSIFPPVAGGMCD
ncbi:MoaD/ThiS family protein [Halogeometricum borinquense]|nr:ubiquitin-like small modifier protein 1 [Halogeometricum borinquense]QIQ75597.1 MoaD/ThiS family protein [Halogeometricum borinquense]